MLEYISVCVCGLWFGEFGWYEESWRVREKEFRSRGTRVKDSATGKYRREHMCSTTEGRRRRHTGKEQSSARSSPNRRRKNEGGGGVSRKAEKGAKSKEIIRRERNKGGSGWTATIVYRCVGSVEIKVCRLYRFLFFFPCINRQHRRGRRTHSPCFVKPAGCNLGVRCTRTQARSGTRRLNAAYASASSAGACSALEYCCARGGRQGELRTHASPAHRLLTSALLFKERKERG